MAMAALAASKRAAGSVATGNDAEQTGKRSKPPQVASSSPVKEKLSIIHRLMHKQGSASADSSAVSSGDPVLEALGAISDKLDRMALKTDVDAIAEKIGQMALKSDVEQMTVDMEKDIKVQIAQAVDPIQNDLHDIKGRLAAVEQRPAAHGATSNPDSSNSMNKLMDKLDPAKKRIVFIGFPDDVQADVRIQKIEEFIKSHASSYRIADSGCFYSGPYNNRKITKVAYVEFGSQDTAKKVLDKLSKAELNVNGTKITIKPARTMLNGQRNQSLRSAEELIKASPIAIGKDIQIDWMIRQVTVDGHPAFIQDKGQRVGSFSVTYSALQIP